MQKIPLDIYFLTLSVAKSIELDLNWKNGDSFNRGSSSNNRCLMCRFPSSLLPTSKLGFVWYVKATAIRVILSGTLKMRVSLLHTVEWQAGTISDKYSKSLIWIYRFER